MPRKSRDRSSLNCYHIVTRGINKQDIFYDDNDRNKFLKEISKTKEKYGYKLYAYALMPNHVHLLIKENDISISNIMSSILVSYAEYINKKYDRIGYVFQDRFMSKPINDDEYLKNVLRYIHLNPQKAGIESYDKYKWSSYQAYIKEVGGLVNIGEIEEKFKNNTSDFVKFHNEKILQCEDEEIMEFEIKKVLEDEDLYNIIKRNLGESQINNIQRYSKEYRDEILMKIFEIKGTNCAQISRVIGINNRLVKDCKERYLKKKRLIDNNM